ncbi:hypothetical protein DFQ30_005581, partial [Apophysomyces sp. BC1015]
AHRVYRDVSLTAFDLLARVETALPPLAVVFTDCESMIATLGVACRPARIRTASRNAVTSACQTPRSRQRQ